MFIKYLDFLSPRITFYHKGLLSHSSILSGIISIIAIIFIIILGIYYSLQIIKRKNPNISYYKNFEKDAGIFQINTSSLFHFVSITKIYRGVSTMEGFDFTSLNIVGAQIYTEGFIGAYQKSGVKSFDHWLYGYCNKEINTEGLDDLITYEYFNKSACIKKYYNSTEEEYYDIGDPKFIWPDIAHGTFNESNKLYGLYIIKCDNNIIDDILGTGYQCKNDSEVDNYLKNKRGSRVLHYHFINTYINALDYNNPINKYFYKIETPLYQNQYTINSINLNPALAKTNNGLVWDKIKEDISYTFERNDVYISNNGGNGLYMGYIFFLKNIKEYYERSYKKVQDVVSNIGGINQAITVIAIIINSLYNNFIILSDTETLLHSSIHIEKKNHRKKSIEYRNLKNKIKEPEIENKDKIKKNLERKKLNNTDNTEIKKRVNKNDNSRSKCISNNEEINNNFNLDSNIKITEDKKNKNKDNKLKEKKNFWSFLCFKISCGKQMEFFKIYEAFRMKIISEEHIIRNHLNIYNLLKVTERKRHIIRTSYHLKNLLQLV